jgi:hypothetical protein
MTGKHMRRKRPSPTPSISILTIARALLRTALLYRKVARAKRLMTVSTAIPSKRRRGGRAAMGVGRGRCPHKKGSPARSLGALSVGATALGAFAVGAFAIGALAIRALAIRRLAIKRGVVDELGIRELRVGRLEVGELLVREETRSQPPTAPRSDREFPA